MKCSLQILLLFLLFPFAKSFATGQMPDRLIYKGDTLPLFANPLEYLENIDSLRPKLLNDKNKFQATSCWRGYFAEWIIINDQLYLTAIFSCNYRNDSIKADLRQLFGSKFKSGKVKADWFSANVISPQGKLLYYEHTGYSSLYEKELEFQFKKGKLTGTRLYDNSRSHLSIYGQDEKELKKFIYTHIRWDSLPLRDDIPFKFWVSCSANEKGLLDSIKVYKKPYQDLSQKELDAFYKKAERVFRSIPDWDVFYNHEKHLRFKRTIPIEFSEDMRKKYQNK